MKLPHRFMHSDHDVPHRCLRAPDDLGELAAQFFLPSRPAAKA
jgi:hypothetical protein